MNVTSIQLSPTKATIDLYLRENVSMDREHLPAVIICPGGGYEFLSERESEPLALAFLSQGYQVIVFNYPVLESHTNLSSEYLDKNAYLLGEVFQLIEKNQLTWKIDPKAVFLLGCSSGGHLASLYATQTNKYSGSSLSKPLGTILCYPVIGFNYGWPQLKLENEDELIDYNTSSLINSTTPDTFIWHTSNDDAVPVLNTLKYCEGLAENAIEFECHIFEDGKHGLSLATRSSAKFNNSQYVNPYIASWFSKCIHWMESKILD